MMLAAILRQQHADPFDGGEVSTRDGLGRVHYFLQSSSVLDVSPQPTFFVTLSIVDWTQCPIPIDSLIETVLIKPIDPSNVAQL